MSLPIGSMDGTICCVGSTQGDSAQGKDARYRQTALLSNNCKSMGRREIGLEKSEFTWRLNEPNE